MTGRGEVERELGMPPAASPQVAQSKQEPVETRRCQRTYQREMQESLVFMLGIRGATTKSHSMGSRHPGETEIKGGAVGGGGGRSGTGRKAGTLTKFTGPERVKWPPLPCTQVHSLPSCTTVRFPPASTGSHSQDILC